MVIYGLDSTLPVTLDMMIAHGSAVMRGSKRACVIVDMPFGTYQESPAQAFASAARILSETGCAGIKLQGGEAMAATVRFLAERGIPVLGPYRAAAAIGQRAGRLPCAGPHRSRRSTGHRRCASRRQAGAFAMVVEGTAEPVARRVSERSRYRPSASAPRRLATARSWSWTICSALSTATSRASSNATPSCRAVSAAVSAVADEVRARRFPGPEHVYSSAPAAPADKRKPGDKAAS